jgi:hypothetical protein
MERIQVSVCETRPSHDPEEMVGNIEEIDFLNMGLLGYEKH